MRIKTNISLPTAFSCSMGSNSMFFNEHINSSSLLLAYRTTKYTKLNNYLLGSNILLGVFVSTCVPKSLVLSHNVSAIQSSSSDCSDVGSVSGLMSIGMTFSDILGNRG